MKSIEKLSGLFMGYLWEHSLRRKEWGGEGYYPEGDLKHLFECFYMFFETAVKGGDEFFEFIEGLRGKEEKGSDYDVLKKLVLEEREAIEEYLNRDPFEGWDLDDEDGCGYSMELGMEMREENMHVEEMKFDESLKDRLNDILRENPKG